MTEITLKRFLEKRPNKIMDNFAFTSQINMAPNSVNTSPSFVEKHWDGVSFK